jgi:glyoxylase-like metal-dependent hydrolase (beta-lactamase superfamily II)
MEQATSEIIPIDLSYLGVGELICSFALPTGDNGCILIETGPASSCEDLVTRLATIGYSLRQLRAIFVTHIHLDHSGGAGTLARQADCPVYVHPLGAPHLADPSRLLASAQRLYADRMNRLWGHTQSVPEHQVRAVEDGEIIGCGNLEIRALHTPGHASHHVAWQVGKAVATGDVAGIRFPGSRHVLPPTPPPDIELDAWFTSISRIRQTQPEQLLLTHFGSVTDCNLHLDQLVRRLQRWQDTTDTVLGSGGTRTDLAAALAALDSNEMAANRVSRDAAERYRLLCPIADNASGLARFWERCRS